MGSRSVKVALAWFPEASMSLCAQCDCRSCGGPGAAGLGGGPGRTWDGQLAPWLPLHPGSALRDPGQVSAPFRPEWGRAATWASALISDLQRF